MYTAFSSFMLMSIMASLFLSTLKWGGAGRRSSLSAKIRCLNYKMMQTEGGGCCFGSLLQREQETKISHRAKKTGQQPQSLTTQVPVHLFHTTVHLLLSSLKACWYFCIITINVPIFFIFLGLEYFSVPSNKVR